MDGAFVRVHVHAVSAHGFRGGDNQRPAHKRPYALAHQGLDGRHDFPLVLHLLNDQIFGEQILDLARIVDQGFKSDDGDLGRKGQRVFDRMDQVETAVADFDYIGVDVLLEAIGRAPLTDDYLGPGLYIGNLRV